MRVLGKFEVIEEIGRGGFAVVYKARDPGLDRVVALKVLAPHLTWDPTFAERFRQEAQATAKLKHPNIVVIHEVGQDEEALYIAMEYLPGQTLAQFLAEQGALDMDRALPILDQVASALDYAHGEGVLHRDVKPSNVMVQESQGADVRATLTDFGLVKAMEGSQSLTSRGTILGSPHYMAPEQADIKRVHEIGPTTDLYALGLVAYEMLVGQGPFPGDTTSTLVARVQYDPPDPQSIREDLPADVAQVLLKALSRQVKDRYPSAGAMVQALRESVEARKEARQREEKLVQLYQQIEKLVEAEDWRTAEARCREILALDPEYRDVPELWMRVRSGRARQRELEQLYQVAQAASERRSWAEAREKCLQIQALEPAYRDVGELLAWAEEELRQEQAADERQAQLAGLYSQAQAALQNGEWKEAEKLCKDILASKSGYRDVNELLARAKEALRRELTEEESQVQMAALYGQVQQALKKKQWGEAERLCGEIEALQPGYQDVGVLREQARYRRAQDEREAQLAGLYKRAQAALRQKDWTQARKLCLEIETLQPGYRNTDKLKLRAEKALARETAAEKLAKVPPEEPVVAGPEPIPAKKRKIPKVVWVVGGLVIVALAIVGVVAWQLNEAAQDRAFATSMARYRATSSAREAATSTAQAQALATEAAVQAALEVPTEWKAQTQETFDDNALLWPVRDAETELGATSRRIAEGVYRWEVTKSGGAVWWSLPGVKSSCGDFHLTVEARTIDYGPQYGVAFRYVDNENFYFWRVWESAGSTVYAHVNDSWTRLASFDASPTRPNETNRLTVVGRGSRFYFFINDQFVGELDDTTYTEGLVGFGIYANEGTTGAIEFDNFELYTP